MNRFVQSFSVLFMIFSAEVTDISAQDFYPLDARNTWSYRVYYNYYPRPMDSVTIQLEVTVDTLMPNGHRYRRLSQPDILGARFVRVDSAYVYYYLGIDAPMYNLRGSPGTIDTISWFPGGRVRVVSVDTLQIFGVSRTVRRYFLDGLVQFEVSLADGFGIVNALDFQDGVWPFHAWWSIRGCVIRDTMYGTVVNVPEVKALPTEFKLFQNYPNPFNPSTTIEFEVPASGPVSLTLVNLLGQTVGQLADGIKPAGRYQVTFNASHNASGIYFYILSYEGGSLRRKMVIIK